MVLAEVFVFGGQGSEASTTLDAAMARFESKGNLASAAEARRRFDRLSDEREGVSRGGSAASGRHR